MNLICSVCQFLYNMPFVRIHNTWWNFYITDIDECLEGTSGCDAVRENCTNLVGGVSCHCLPEYVRVEGECQCELKVSFCSAVYEVLLLECNFPELYVF